MIQLQIRPGPARHEPGDNRQQLQRARSIAICLHISGRLSTCLSLPAHSFGRIFSYLYTIFGPW
jgi:hypothetical protein